MNEIKKIVYKKAADQQSQKDEIKEMNDKSSTYTKEVSKIEIKKRVVNFIKNFGKKITDIFNKEEYGKVIILIGQRKSGKSETVKTLCKKIQGDKYIIKFDENLLPTEIPIDDKKDWKKIQGCNLIENEEQLSEVSGYLILEDFPYLNNEAVKLIYNKIKDCRHSSYQANYIIIAHSYDVLKNTVLEHANAILIFRDAAIKSLQLGARLGDLGSGFAINRAKNNLPAYHYIFVSLDNKKWCNPFIDSRDVNILKKFLKGKLKKGELKDIIYPKKSDKLSKPKEKTKREIIEQLIKEGYSQEEILAKVNTSIEYIWKVKTYMKKRYIRENGSENLPSYLKDNRKKEQLKKEIIEMLEELF